MVTLHWIKCQNDEWYNLHNVNLESIGDLTGVYMIWHIGKTPHVVRIGQGNIKERLHEDRLNEDIHHYSLEGNLFVTWAEAPSEQLDGIERYLADIWQPQLGFGFPDVEPIKVNSPLMFS